MCLVTALKDDAHICFKQNILRLRGVRHHDDTSVLKKIRNVDVVLFKNHSLQKSWFSACTTSVVNWLIGQLVNWLIGQLVNWLIGQLVNWLIGQHSKTEKLPDIYMLYAVLTGVHPN